MATSFKHSILITGGTSGLGYYAALEISRQSPDSQVIIASRSDPNAAADAINKQLGQTNVKFLKLDLSSLANVRQFAQSWGDYQFPPISALVFNAALQFPGKIEYTEDGFEKTFGISHVGHALLFGLLRSHLANEARIVITSSGTHDPAQKSGLPDAVYTSAEGLAHPSGKMLTAPGRQHYTNTKLSNILYTYALDRRFRKINENSPKQWTVTAFDPGLMPGTGLARDASAFLRFLWNSVMPRITPLLRLVVSKNVHAPQDSGASLARLVIGHDVEGVSGVYFEGRKKIDSSKDSYVEAKQEDLWNWSVETVAVDEKEKSLFALKDLL